MIYLSFYLLIGAIWGAILLLQDRIEPIDWIFEAAIWPLSIAAEIERLFFIAAERKK